jgi:hypothetical protein
MCEKLRRGRQEKGASSLGRILQSMMWREAKGRERRSKIQGRVPIGAPRANSRWLLLVLPSFLGRGDPEQISDFTLRGTTGRVDGSTTAPGPFDPRFWSGKWLGGVLRLPRA